MSGTFLNLTNKVLARLNEVQLTTSSFTTARGIQVQAQNAVNESIRYINQREFNYPFNHATVNPEPSTDCLSNGSVCPPYVATPYAEAPYIATTSSADSEYAAGLGALGSS